MKFRQLLDQLAGIVGKDTVGDDDFYAVGRAILREDGAQSLLDEGGFVVNRKEDGKKRERHYNRALFVFCAFK